MTTEAEPPRPITRAVFAAAPHDPGLTSAERRAARARARARLRPPGFIGARWVAETPFFYDYGGLGSGDRHVFPTDKVVDGASVPWIFTFVVPRAHSLYLAATALHDWHYDLRAPAITREKADAVLWEAAIFLGLHWFWATVIWRATRAGGWMHWRRPDAPMTLARRLWAVGEMAVTSARFVLGFAVDLARLPAYRAAAKRIAERSDVDADRRAG